MLLLFSFFAGFITVLSPCILPILPILLAGSINQDYKKRFGIVLGIIISFSFFTLFLTTLVQTTGISPNALRYGALIIIIFFGCTLLFPKLESWFAAKTSFLTRIGGSLEKEATHIQQEFWSGTLLGIALGLIWTPCAGPILGSITTLVASHQLSLDIVYTTLAYSIGAASPMFFIMYFGNKISSSIGYLSHYTETIRKIFGALMVMSACAILLHIDVWLQKITLRYFPNIELENKLPIRKELEKLVPLKNKAFVFTPENSTPKAPDIIGIDQWLNSPPLSPDSLKGKVVLLDFWTYSCINCIRTLPYLNDWYAKYKDKGLVIIGVHTPEFEFEKNIDNVKNALIRFDIHYPVAIDNDYQTWQNYNNMYWPTHYLINQEGNVVEKHAGEGAYLETENAIRSLLGLEPLSQAKEDMSYTRITPETYLGYARGKSYVQEISLRYSKTHDYTYTNKPAADQVAIQGSWLASDDAVQAKGEDCKLELNFSAAQVYLVMQADDQVLVDVELDGKALAPESYTGDMNEQGQIVVRDPRTYHVVNLKNSNGRHLLTLSVPKGIVCYVFTFGS